MPFRFKEEFPNLANELAELLHDVGEHSLARQVLDCRILDRCRCGDDFCAMMYSAPPPRPGPWPRPHRNVAFFDGPLLVLDVVHEELAAIEVLDRDEIRQKLLRLMP